MVGGVRPCHDGRERRQGMRMVAVISRCREVSSPCLPGVATATTVVMQMYRELPAVRELPGGRAGVIALSSVLTCPLRVDGVTA